MMLEDAQKLSVLRKRPDSSTVLAIVHSARVCSWVPLSVRDLTGQLGKVAGGSQEVKRVTKKQGCCTG